MKTILTGKQSANNYPYGFSLKTTIYYWVEYKKGKGYRGVTQTINPKTGKLNAPKASTYSHLVYLVKDSERGYFSFEHLNIRDIKDVETLANLFSNNPFDAFTFSEVESVDLWAIIISCLRVSLTFYQPKEGVPNEQVLEAAKVREFVKAYKEKININTLPYFKFSAQAIYDLTDKKEIKYTITSYGING